MSQTGKYLEPIVLEMKSILQAGLATKVAAIDIINKTITSHTPVSFFAGRYYLMDSGQMPAFIVWPESDAGNEYSNETLYFRARITIWAIDYDDDQERLQRRLFRWQEAIVDTIKATDNLNGECDLCTFAGLSFDNPWTTIERSGYIDAMGVVFEIQNEEEIS